MKKKPKAIKAWGIYADEKEARKTATAHTGALAIYDSRQAARSCALPGDDVRPVLIIEQPKGKR